MSIAINFVCKFNNVEFIIRDLCEALAQVGNDCTVYPYQRHYRFSPRVQKHLFNNRTKLHREGSHRFIVFFFHTTHPQQLFIVRHDVFIFSRGKEGFSSFCQDNKEFYAYFKQVCCGIPFVHLKKESEKTKSQCCEKKAAGEGRVQRVGFAED